MISVDPAGDLLHKKVASASIHSGHYQFKGVLPLSLRKGCGEPVF